jgi:hypothetical protein
LGDLSHGSYGRGKGEETMIMLVLLGLVACAVYGATCLVRAELSESGGAARWLRYFGKAWRS